MYKIFVYNPGQIINQSDYLFCSSDIEDLAVINPVISLEANKAGTFTFTVPPNHPRYNMIQKRKSQVLVYRDGDWKNSEPLFEGFAVDETIDFYKQKTITCEGILSAFNNSYLRPHKYEDVTTRQLLEAYVSNHNDSVIDHTKKFTVGQVTVHDSNDSIYCYTNYNSTMTEMNEDLVKDLGGYFRVRYTPGQMPITENERFLDYLADSPHTASQIIKLGLNLIDLSQNFDTTDVATVIIPLGATLDTQSIEGLDERLTIKTAPASTHHIAGTDYVYSAEGINTFGRIERVVEWDDVTTPSALLSKGEEYLTNTQWDKLVLDVRAVDLGLTTDEFQKFKLLDLVRVVSEPHGLDRYFMLSKMEINLNNPERDTITLGIEEQHTLSTKTAQSSETLEKKIVEQSGVLRGAIDNATALLCGAEGGYVIIGRNDDGQPIEIRIQDALENPNKIWLWNVNGLGYSSDGGTTFGTAITMDGRIVADYVTAGTMSANRVKGGTFEVGGSSVAANGTITVKDASNHSLLQISKDGLTLYDTSGNVKANLTHSGLTVNGGTINASTINGASINGVGISANCTIQTEKFSVNGAGNVFWWGDGYSGGELSGSRCVGRLGVISYGDLYVSGSKDRIVETKDYGYQLLNAYETPTPYFGDIGEGVIDDNGECYVFIDPVLAQCIDDICKYQVFLQSYGSEAVYVDSRDPDYFIVKGAPGTSFAWELKAVQKDFNGVRFNEVDPEVIEIMEKAKE